MGRKVNHQAGIWHLIRVKHTWYLVETNSTRGLLGLLLFRVIQIGEFVQLDVACSWNRSRVSRVFDCFAGEIHHSREIGPPEQPQREVRRSLAQSRPAAAPRKFTRTFEYLQGRRKPSSPSLVSRKPHEHRPGDGFGQKFDRCIPVAGVCVRLRGGASHPRRPKSDSLTGGAGRNNLPLTAAPRGGHEPSLALLVACARLPLCALFLFLLNYGKGMFFHEIPHKLNQVHFFLFDYHKKVSR